MLGISEVISIYGLQKRFGRKLAFDLTVDAGEVYGFLGPNGASVRNYRCAWLGCPW
jgi:ABC-type multidrug transport system ATPase subunit